MGEEKLVALLQENLHLATRSGAARPADFTRVIIDTTVQPKAIAFPTDAKLLHRARERLVRLAQKHAVPLRQSYVRVGKVAPIRHQRYAHAKQFKRANRSLRTLRTYLGRVTRDIGRKIVADDSLKAVFAQPLSLARQVRAQKPRQRGHNAPKLPGLRVYTAGQKRGVTDAIRRAMRRRSAVEPVIGHLKDDHRMDRNYLAGREGDAANAILAAVGYNFRLLFVWLEALLRALMAVPFVPTMDEPEIAHAT